MADSGSARVVELFFKGDNRSAVKALEGIATQSKETTDTLKGDADEQTVAMTKVRESSERVRGAMMGMMGMVGIGGVAFGLKDLAEGGMQLQGAQAGLRASLKATGDTAAATFDQLSKSAESMSTKGGFGTTQNLSALTAFVRETKSATEAQKLMSLSTNIARARNIDLATAQQSVQRAYLGQGRGLQALIGPMAIAKDATVGLTTAHAQQIATLTNESSLMGKMGGIWLRQQMVNDHITAQQAAMAQLTDKHAAATQILAAATQTFGGYAEKTYSSTTEGRISNIKNAFHNLADTLGLSLLPAMNKIVGVGESVAEWMAKNKTLVLDASLAFAGLGAAMVMSKGVKALLGLKSDLVGVAKALGLVTVTEEETTAVGVAGAGEMTVAWDAFFAGTIIGLGIVALVEIATHWKQFESLVVGVWHSVTGAVSGAWHGIEGVVSKGVNFVWSKIKWLADEAKKLIADTPLGGLIGFGSNLLGGHVGRAFGDLAQGATLGAVNAGSSGGLVNLNTGGSSSGQQHITVSPQSEITLRTNDREIGKATLRWALNSAARGPTSLSGGSLQTGAPGLSSVG